MKPDPKTIIDGSQDPYISRPIVQQQKIKQVLPPHIPKYHWVRDKPDDRDHIYQLSRTPQTDTVDLRLYCSPIENQGDIGACTGNAIAGAIELLTKRQRKQRDISRLFIYYFERLIEGTVNYDSGAYIRDGIKACYRYGASLESLWPYDPSKFRNRPSIAAINDGAKRKVTSYERVLNHDGCLDALSRGFPVIIGFDVYDSFESDIVAETGIMPYPDVSTEELVGSHCVLLVGYNKNTQMYIARNSWGTSWGLNGYFYMPFQVIQDTNMSGDFWIIKSANNP